MGVYYTFKIVGIDENGLESKPQNFSITFSDGKIKKLNPDGSVVIQIITFAHKLFDD